MPEPVPIDWEAFYRSYRKPGYIPGFEILHKIGGGAFGMVFKARKESIDKLYAIKFLKVDDEGVRDAIVSELQSVRFFAQVDHPNLVSIEDKGECDGIPFIVMNYAGDTTLRRRLEQGAMPREDALRTFLQVARGVQALHDHSLVHFDIKPGNVFLRGDHARVGDYGLSRLVTQSRNSLSFGRGTPYYMAPEMLQRRGDHRSDIYSLGVLLYECLTGDVPFRGDSEWEVLRKHETEAPHLPAELCEPERGVVARCLAKQPVDRFDSVRDLIAALEGAPAQAAAAFPNIPAPPPPPPPSCVDVRLPQRPTRRRRRAERPAARASVTVLVLLFAIAMPAMLFVMAKTEERRHRAIAYAEAERPAYPAASSRPSPPDRLFETTRHAYETPDPRTLPALPYGSSNSRRSYVQKYVGRWVSPRTCRSDKPGIARRLAKYRESAIAFTINELRRLNYHRTNDARTGSELHGLLTELTGLESPFIRPSRTRRPRSSEASHNEQLVVNWWNYWQDRYGRRRSASR